MQFRFPKVQQWAAAILVALTAIIVPLASVATEAAGPTQWRAAVGVQSPNRAVQANFFFPDNITIDAGDSILWTLKSDEFHTVSLLSGGAPPPLLVFGPGGPTFNPDVLFPKGGNTYNGTGYVNSGAMGVAAPRTFTLTFTTPGNYQYNCLVHTPMKGWVHVQPAGTSYPHSQLYYDAQAGAAEARSIRQGYGLMALGLFDALSAGVGNVTAGIGRFYATGSIAIVGFLPKVNVVHVGQTVTWNNRDPEFPHTVTFNLQGFDAANPLMAAVPINAANGSATINSTSDGVNSGFLVAGGPTLFRVKFTTPGAYNYYCALHDDLGMKGTVLVLPGD